MLSSLGVAGDLVQGTWGGKTGNPTQFTQGVAITQGHVLTLGAEGVLPGRQIESFLRVFKQFTPILPRG